MWLTEKRKREDEEEEEEYTGRSYVLDQGMNIHTKIITAEYPTRITPEEKVRYTTVGVGGVDGPGPSFSPLQCISLV